VPDGFGNWKTVYNRHRRWSGDGTWQEILNRLRAGCDEAEGRDWALSADSTVVRTHQHAAGARRARPVDLVPGAAANDKNRPAGPGREALGRSRGGLSAKIHLAADGRCRPVARILSPGQHGDCPRFIPLMDAVRIARRGPGRPRTRPGRRAGRQGVLVGGQPRLPAQARDQDGHPGEGGPEETPPRPRPRGRPPPCRRRRALQGAQHR
jgi:transposase